VQTLEMLGARRSWVCGKTAVGVGGGLPNMIRMHCPAQPVILKPEASGTSLAGEGPRIPPPAHGIRGSGIRPPRGAFASRQKIGFFFLPI